MGGLLSGASIESLLISLKIGDNIITAGEKCLSGGGYVQGENVEVEVPKGDMVTGKGSRLGEGQGQRG